MISGGFSAPYLALVPAFERETGMRLITIRGPSMGNDPTAIPVRLSRGEAADVLIMVRSALDGLIRAGRVIPRTEVDLVRSRIGLAVKAGSPKPDISTVASLKRTLLGAKSVAYSDSASGVYVSGQLFRRLGIVHEMAAKAHMVPAIPVGKIVAEGRAEVGFQQLSELLPIAGIQVVGPIPDAVQKVTVFSGGVSTTSTCQRQARRLIGFLASSNARKTIENAGLEPVIRKAR
ncbi:MAG TPA: substrate-binding domain-containing protein [Bryobacteraceae bacterium]|jgi:molybdate transport system substrate-binding protein